MTSRKKKKKRAGQRNRIDKREKKFDFFMQKKLLLLFGIVVVVFFLLNFRIAGITLENGEEYTQQVLSQKYYDSVTIPYKRGDIVDRNGNIFARSEKVCNVVLDCFAINSDSDFLEPTLEALEQIFEIDKNEVRGIITAEETKESRYQVILKDVDFEKEQEFEKLTEIEEIPDDASESEKARIKGDNAWKSCVKGVWFEESYIREYPMNSMASTVVGFSNKANDGVAGLELYYNDILNGTNGREYGYLTEQSELERKIVEPQDGNRLVTTIDMNIQRVVEKYLN